MMTLTNIKEISAPFLVRKHECDEKINENMNLYGFLLLDEDETIKVYQLLQYKEKLWITSDFCFRLTHFLEKMNPEHEHYDFLELLQEIGSVKDYRLIRKNETNHLDYICDVQDRSCEPFEYILMDKQFKNPMQQGGSVSLTLHIEAKGIMNSYLSRKDYESVLTYRVIREVRGRYQSYSFPFTERDLHDAIRQFKHFTSTFSFQQIS